MELSGILAPVTTPFDAETGEADLIAMRRNVRQWLLSPISGLVLFGSTGEGVLLDEEERIRILVATREVVPPDRLVLVGVGAESTRATARRAREAAGHGADAVLVHPPSYYRPEMTPEALREHFLHVAEESPIPVVLYQVPPKLGGVDLAAGLVGELSRHQNVVGIKDSTGDLKSVAAYTDACERGCAVLVGSGAALFGALEVGARGGILALALLAPEECVRVHRLWTEERLGEAGRLQERIARAHREIVAPLGVPGMKVALDLLGMVGGSPRSPLRPLPAKQRDRVRRVLDETGLLAPAEA